MWSILAALALTIIASLWRVGAQRRREQENRSMRAHLLRLSDTGD